MVDLMVYQIFGMQTTENSKLLTFGYLFYRIVMNSGGWNKTNPIK